MTLEQMRKLVDRMIRVLERMRPVALKAIQKHAIWELRLIHQAFRVEQYFDEYGVTEPVEAYGDRWRQEKKKRKGWSMRKGWASGTLGKAIGNRQTIGKTADGYDLDPSRSNPIVARYTTRGHPGSFVTEKAPGLMQMGAGWSQRHAKVVRKALNPLLKELGELGAKLQMDPVEIRAVMSLDLNESLALAAQASKLQSPPWRTP